MSANIAINPEMKQAYVDYAQSVIVSKKDEQTMTSLQIAEITGKRHSDVMRAIRALPS